MTHLRILLLLFTVLLCGVDVSAAPAAIDSVIETVAGTGQDTDGPDRGPATKTNVGNPFGVELGPDGALYICEVSNHRVRRLDVKTGQLTTVAGCGEKGYSGDGGPAKSARLNEPYEVRFDTAGNMYFVEMKNHLIRRVDAKTGNISTVAGSGKPGFAGDGGPARGAMFRSPHSIALDETGGLYVADIGNQRIRRIDLTTGTIATIAGDGRKQLPRDGAMAKGRPILGPRALFYSKGVLWIALREGHSVGRIDLKTGIYRHVAGTGRRGYVDGPARKAAFNGPKGIAVDDDGNDADQGAGAVYVVDTENQAIRRIDLSTGVVTTAAGRGPDSRGYAGDGGPASAARLARPHGICVGPGGVLYIGDSENHRVRRIRPKK
jgi:streptogramin lyase